MAYQPLKLPLEVKFGAAAYDSFGRQRVSQTFAHARILQLNDNLPNIYHRVSNGTAAQVYSTAEKRTQMTTSASGDYAIAQTYQRFPYSAFDGQVWAVTQNNFAPEANIIKRCGYFNGGTAAPYDTFDGLFFQSDSTNGVTLNIYKNGVQQSSIQQGSWNVDNLDGNGPSGINFTDWEDNTILGADFQYLGLGAVAWYADINRQLVLLHIDEHAFVGLQGVYMGSPNQPIRYEIRQTGAGSGTFNQICSSVSKEGSTNQLGEPKVVRNPISTPISVGNGGIEAIIGIRLKSTHLDAQVRFLDVSTFVLNNTIMQWYLYRNPTITGTALTWIPVTNSPIEYAVGTGTTVITENIAQEIASDMTIARGGNEKLLDSYLRLGSSINGTPDEFILGGKAASGTANAIGTINHLISL